MYKNLVNCVILAYIQVLRTCLNINIIKRNYGRIFDKFIPNEVKEVFKPVAKFSKKFIPKELRPFLAMGTPFLPSLGIMGQLGGPLGFANECMEPIYLVNILADPDAEFDDLNQFAALLSGTQGGLTNTGTAQNLSRNAKLLQNIYLKQEEVCLVKAMVVLI